MIHVLNLILLILCSAFKKKQNALSSADWNSKKSCMYKLDVNIIHLLSAGGFEGLDDWCAHRCTDTGRRMC